MKTLAIVGVLAVHLLAQPNSTTAKHETDATDHAQQAPTARNNCEPAANAAKTDSEPPRWYTSSEWWLVIVAGLTGIFIAWQARETAHAAKAMEQSTGTQMGVEQGRASIIWDPRINRNKVTHEGTQFYFNWYCENWGKTPITLKKIASRFIVVRSLNDVPQKPNYGACTEVRYQGEPLFPTEPGVPDSGWFSNPLETALPLEEITIKINNQSSVLYAYGVVEYTDIWGRPHEMRFGVVFDPRKPDEPWRVAGPPEYNKYD